MRRISVVLALGLLLTFAGTASALEVTETGSEELTLVSSTCGDVTLLECTYVLLTVVDAEDARGSEVCLQILTGQPLDETTFLVLAMETGCAPIDPADLSFGDRLSSATLAATSIDLTYCDNTVDPPACEPSRTVTVSATALATSPQGRLAQAFPIPTPEGCREVIRVMLTAREATGEFSVDDTTYAGTGTILTGTRTVMTVAC
jgi:hypothetical protein